LSIVCFSCERYGHSKEVWSQGSIVVDSSGEKDLMIGISYAISGSMVGTDKFDPWMLVERKTRHNPREHNNFGKSGNTKKSSRSRFNSLTSLNIDESGSDLGNDDNFMGIGQSKGTGYVLGPGGDFADLLEGRSICISWSSGRKVQKIVGLKDIGSVVPSDVLGWRVGGMGDMVTFIPTSFRVLDTKKDITVVFQENSNPNLTKVHVDNEAFKSGMSSIPIKGWDSGGKVIGSKKVWKINKTLKGSSNRFKVLGSSRVSLAGSMLLATALISSELDGQVIKKTVMVGGFKVDAIIAKLGLKRSHRVEVVGFSRAILSVEEKKCGQVACQACSFFGEFVHRTKVYDLGFKGSPFAWHHGALFERLDRVLGNDV
ncbi:hypothetical protein Goshw_019035, partial [Gossypium schwendimanii]|nr:hypothetical protein [Gossypium schwendimanii]